MLAAAASWQTAQRASSLKAAVWGLSLAMILTTGIRRQPALGPLRTKLNSRHRQHRSSRRLHGCSTSIFPRPTLRLRMLSPRILHSPRGRDLGPEPRRRSPGRRFVLHGLSGLSYQVCCPLTQLSATCRTRSAAAAACLLAAIPEPAAPTTITEALATLRPQFLLF